MGSGEQVEEPVGRNHQVGLQHLDIEADADDKGCQQQPAQPPRLSRLQHCPGSQEQYQGQGAINRHIAIGQDTDGIESQGKRCQQASDDPKVASDQVVEEPNGQHASQCLGQEDADRVEAKNLGAGRLQPEAHWGLVDRDEATWIIGDKKEILPTIQHASDGGRIIGPEAVLAQRIEVHDD